MASSWGDSWGTSWGTSWNGSIIPIPVEVSAFGGVRKANRPRRVIFDLDDKLEEKELQPITVVEVKKLIARKITSKTIAQPVQKIVLNEIKLNPIDLTQAKQLVDTVKQQEIERNIRLRQLRDDGRMR